MYDYLCLLVNVYLFAYVDILWLVRLMQSCFVMLAKILGRSMYTVGLERWFNQTVGLRERSSYTIAHARRSS